MRLNYCFSVPDSGWIANLGVLPLLLFWALRFLPNLTFLLALRLRVTRVLETISRLLCYRPFFLRPPLAGAIDSFLPQIIQKVKKALSGLFLLLAWGLGSGPVWGGDASAVASPERKPLILGRGEVREIALPKIAKYTVGNKEVLRVWAKQGPSQLVLKGVKLGSSDLLVWTAGGPPVLYQVIVVSKRQQLAWAKWPPMLSPLGISADYVAGELKLKGQLRDYTQYLSFAKLFRKAYAESSKKSGVFLWETGNLQLDAQLKKKIQAEVFYLSLKSYRDDLNCTFQDVFLECHHNGLLKLPSDLKRQLEAKGLIRWLPVASHPHEQFNIKMVLFQFEKFGGQSVQLGLDLLKGRLEAIFDRGPAFFIKQNEALFNQQSTHASTLAEPQLVVWPGKKGKISIGSDIPFQSKKDEEVVLNWKFAGLKIEVEAVSKGPKVLLQYRAELTYPSPEGNISGSRESSQVLVTPGRPFQLFEIGHRALGTQHSALPLIAKIPVLRSLLSSRDKRQSYKKIVAILTLDKIHD